jgi:hypothetical protein
MASKERGDNLKKTALALVLFVLLALFGLIIGSVFAQTVPKPSVPEFTLNLDNETVVLTIENQPFDIHNTYNYTFYYDVRIKSIDGSWVGVYSAEERPIQSDSSTTVLYYTIAESTLFPNVTTVARVVILPSGSASFQVMALIGYLEGTGLVGKVSGWSSSQRITVTSPNAFDTDLYVSPETWDTSYKIVLFSPNEQTIYNYTLPLAFILSWTFVPLPGMDVKAEYAYRIDDNSFVSIFPNDTSKKLSFSYMIDISSLPEGYHNLVIKATFYQGPNMILDTSSTPFEFIVRTPIHTPAPSAKPTPALSPTPSPTSTSTPEPTPTINTGPSAYYFDDFIVAGVAGAVAIAFLVLLFYLIKRK